MLFFLTNFSLCLKLINIFHFMFILFVVRNNCDKIELFIKMKKKKKTNEKSKTNHKDVLTVDTRNGSN